MVKNIIFDMDGVLLDSEAAIRAACLRMLEAYGVRAGEEDFIPFTGMGETKFIGGVAEKYGVAFEPKMKTEAYAIYGELADELVVVYDGVKDLLFTLKQKGCKVAVASSADEVKVRINLRCIGVDREDFDAVITGTDVANNKPDPEVFLTALAALGGDPRESLVVEDAVSGCQAAVAAGMRCVGVTSTFSGDRLREAGADWIVERTVDILPIVENA